tara:strand:- start:783 stop:1106 length:324 start_codon:yes stop_codon:yes gene_type:complete
MTTQTADYTRLLLLQRHGSDAMQQAATTALQALAVRPQASNEATHKTSVSKATTEAKGLPLPHGSTYETLAQLVADVTSRCREAKFGSAMISKLIVHVSQQYHGAVA